MSPFSFQVYFVALYLCIAKIGIATNAKPATPTTNEIPAPGQS